MPAPTIAKDEVLRRIFGVFQTYGYEGATLARISSATGLGRASLYHYFPGGKDDMARDVLAGADTFIAERVAAVLDGPGEPQARIRAMIAALREAYAGGAASCVINLLGVGDAGEKFGSELSAVTQRWIDALARLVRAGGAAAQHAERLAIDVVVRVEGALIVSRALGDTGVFLRALTDVEQLLVDEVEGHAATVR